MWHLVIFHMVLGCSPLKLVGMIIVSLKALALSFYNVL